MDLTPDTIQAISVKAVTAFMKKQASLNDAIASEARSMELNPDQIKRVIEASNSIAYLRQLQDNGDRTFEFPVADYKQVMTSIAMPSTNISTPEVQMVEKQASKNQDYTFELSEQEKVAMLAKEVLISRQSLEKIACDKSEIAQQLMDKAASARKDKHVLEKLIHVVDEEDFDSMLRLVGIEKSASENVLFSDNDLDSVKELYSLYKKAHEVLSYEKSQNEFIKRASDILEKKAFLGALGRVVGSVVGSSIRSVGKGISSTFQARSGVGESLKKLKKSNPNATRSQVLGNYSRDKMYHGEPAATAMHGFKPHMLNRVSTGVAFSAAFAPGYDHKNQVWDTLHPKA